MDIASKIYSDHRKGEKTEQRKLSKKESNRRYYERTKYESLKRRKEYRSKNKTHLSKKANTRRRSISHWTRGVELHVLCAKIGRNQKWLDCCDKRLSCNHYPWMPHSHKKRLRQLCSKDLSKNQLLKRVKSNRAYSNKYLEALKQGSCEEWNPKNVGWLED